MNATPPSDQESKPQQSPRASREESGYHEPYAEYHRNLRVWFIAYGVGAPALLTQVPNGVATLKADGLLTCVAVFFLLGVLLQVLTAVIYKSAMWYLYMEEIGHLEDTTRRYTVSEWLSGAYWLELLLDLATIGLFSIATIMTVSSIVRGA